MSLTRTANEAVREIALGDLTIRAPEALVTIAGEPTALRRREFALLRFLASHPNRVFRREEILREVWGSDYHGTPRTVDTHIRRLRERLGEFGQQHLQTVRGVGYRMATPRSQKAEGSRQ